MFPRIQDYKGLGNRIKYLRSLAKQKQGSSFPVKKQPEEGMHLIA